ncbi:MAG: hypothetical protein QOG38_2560, partial [Hyphomicrobiales bacterium]|nr:hypothetical protein [Hyphomicrobiales bacterium]
WGEFKGDGGDCAMHFRLGVLPPRLYLTAAME